MEIEEVDMVVVEVKIINIHKIENIKVKLNGVQEEIVMVMIINLRNILIYFKKEN